MERTIVLGVTGTKTVRMALEAAIVGSLDHHGRLLRYAVSDSVDQFDVFHYGLCRIQAA